MPPTAQSLWALWKRLRTGHVRILWLVLGALLMVSVLPLGLYHRLVLQLSQDKLVDTERVQQTDLVRTLAQEIQHFESNLTDQLLSERQILDLTGLIKDVEDPAAEPKVTHLLQNFVESNPSTFLYLTAVGKSGRGTKASQGNFQAEQDPFVAKALQRAFVTCLQSQQLQVTKFRSDPLALVPDNRPAFVIAVPLKDVNDNFTGMLAAVVLLDPILRRLQDASVRGRSVFIVDHDGHIVAHHDTKSFVPGADARDNVLVAQVRALPRDLRNTATMRFTDTVKKRSVEMIGTYSTFPELNWAVIAQRRLDEAESDAGVNDMNRQALAFAAIVEKDPYTRGHSGRVAKYSTLIGQELGLSTEELDKLRISALLHDVGKIGVEDRVLKKPGALTPEEFGLMKQHTVKGANIMRPVSQLKEMLPGIELHHEHIDGRGYPYGLSGPQIPQMARIIGVADTLDAMTTNRPYQTAMELDYAMGRIRALAGSKFDPAIVAALDSAVKAGKLRLTAVEVQV